MTREEAARKEVAEREQAAERERNRRHLNDEERAALNDFARENGRLWKAKLRKAWENAIGPEHGFSSMLQTLRNARYFGPKGLQDYRVPA